MFALLDSPVPTEKQLADLRVTLTSICDEGKEQCVKVEQF